MSHVDDLENTHWEPLYTYDHSHWRVNLENPRLCSLVRSLDSIPKYPCGCHHSFKSIVWLILWIFLKSVLHGSRTLDLVKNLTIWSLASFSRTLKIKHNNDIGERFAGDDGIGTFLCITPVERQRCLWSANWARPIEIRVGYRWL